MSGVSSPAALQTDPESQRRHNKGLQPSLKNKTQTGLANPIGKQSLLSSWPKATVTFLKEQWFLLALAALIAIASQVQVPPSQQHIKGIVIEYLCVSLIFFITGCTLDTSTLLQNYSRWRVHVFVNIQCFLMTSASVYGIV